VGVRVFVGFVGLCAPKPFHWGEACSQPACASSPAPFLVMPSCLELFAWHDEDLVFCLGGT